VKVTIKFILLIGVIFLIVGLVGVGFVFKTTDLESGLTNVDLEKKISAADIQNLTIESDIAGVVFIPSNNDEIRVHLTGSVSEDRMKETKLEATLNGKNTWKVQASTQKHFMIGLHIADIKSIFFLQKEKRLRMEVELPQKAFHEINVTTNTGFLDLSDIQTERLKAQADTGTISIGRFQGKHMDLQTDTGKIIVKEGEGNVRLKTDTGSIEATLRSLGDSVNVQTDTGSVRLNLDSLPSSVKFDISNDTGSIDFQVPHVHYEEQYKHSVKAKIGEGDSSVKVQTDTGTIEVRG
jgi:DUF4097 and DUF4098 domain-containing protein YvlB